MTDTDLVTFHGKKQHCIIFISVTLLALILLSACSSPPQYGHKLKSKSPAAIAKGGISSDTSRSSRKGGGYYLDDGPGDNPPPDLHLTPDAVPRNEPLRAANMQPYVAMGKLFKPMTELDVYKERGVASWYGRRYHGNNTATGEVYDMYAMTAAHPTLPLPSYARVTNLTNGKSIVVRLNDRGPFLSDRLIDLSYTAALKLGILDGGSGQVEVESILPDDERTRLVIKSSDTSKPTAHIHSTSNPSATNAVYLQLGAFGSQDNAHSFLSQARKKLPWLDTAINVSKNNGLYKVHAGPYSDTILAKQAANTISQYLAITPVVVID